MTKDDEERAITIMVEDIWTLGKPPIEQQFADVCTMQNALSALLREFDITPKGKP